MYSLVLFLGSFYILCFRVIWRFLVFALLAWVLCLALSTPFSWSYPVVLYIAQIIVRLIIK